MQVSVENTSNLERKLTVSVPADRLETSISKRLQELSRTVRLKGFRPGKVPAKVIEQRFGAQVRSEAMGDLIRESFNEAVRKENLRPAVSPSIDTTGKPEDGEIRYIATFEVMPEIGDIDVSSLEVQKPVSSVAAEDVDRMIETLRMQRRSWEAVERKARKGDMILFESFAETDEGRVPAEGMDRAGTIIGSNALFEEFEDKLTGLKKDAEKSFDITFPDAYRVKELAGRKAKVSVKAIRISEAKIPEVDQEFIASFGIRDGGIDRFREEVRANLEREMKGALMMRLKNEVVEKLVEAHNELEFPSRMIDAEMQGLVAQAQQQAQQRGSTFDKSADDFREPARKRVMAAVLLGEIARQNDLRLDPKRVNEMLATIASTYEEPEQVIELYRQDEELMSGLQSRVLEDQVIDWIAEHGKLEEKAISFSELMQPIMPG